MDLNKLDFQLQVDVCQNAIDFVCVSHILDLLMQGFMVSYVYREIWK